jgi:predicted phage-related endonuclease
MNAIAESHRIRIGCSQIAQALGMSRWGTAYDLWSVHTGRSEPDDIGDNLRVALGEPMEDVLRPFVAARIGRELRRDRREYLHPSLPLVGHVDYRAARLKGESARPIVDMKTSLGFGARHRFGDDGTDQVDDDVLLQMHGYMLLSGADRAFVAALVPGPEIKIYTIERDQEMHELIAEGVERFWTLVQTDTPPDPTSEAEARQRWSRHTERLALELSGETAELLRRYASLKAQEKHLEREIQAARDALMPALADAEEIRIGGQKVATYRANKDGCRTDWQAAFRDATQDVEPDVIERFVQMHTTRTPGARVLRMAKTLEQKA